jgi:hypothetical protein
MTGAAFPVDLALNRRSPTPIRAVLRGNGRERMATTSAERQRAYRARRPCAGENGERRLQNWVSTAAALALGRLARHAGIDSTGLPGKAHSRRRSGHHTGDERRGLRSVPRVTA